MTSTVAVLSAAIFHFCIRFAVFISPSKKQPLSCAQCGGFPALLILIGVCVLITDIEVFSNRYSGFNLVVFRVLETILTLLWIEFSMIMIWTQIENGIVAVIKHILSRGNMYQEIGGDSFIALILSGGAICFLIYTMNVTNTNIKFAQFLMKSHHEILEFWNRIKVMSKRGSSGQCPINATIITCQQKCPPANRNPSCPIHGDAEINSCGRRRKC